MTRNSITSPGKFGVQKNGIQKYTGQKFSVQKLSVQKLVTFERSRGSPGRVEGEDAVEKARKRLENADAGIIEA